LLFVSSLGSGTLGAKGEALGCSVLAANGEVVDEVGAASEALVSGGLKREVLVASVAVAGGAKGLGFSSSFLANREG